MGTQKNGLNDTQMMDKEIMLILRSKMLLFLDSKN